MVHRKIVYTYGAFDLLHPAHVQLLEKAKDMGCHLVVGILSDEAIRCRKGNDRPIQPYDDRSFIVRSLRCVDEVVRQETYDPVPSMNKYEIDILTKGDDWDDCIISAKQYGCEFKKLYYNDKYSTTKMVKKINEANK
jgi:D-beta-D-heptose 7-phosphate kinase/D-beta-D-heptose 1-phosphate adenosyltransferase